MSEQVASYDEYMSFACPEDENLWVDPWRPERLSSLLRILNATCPEVTPEEAKRILACYDQPESRFFHGPEHGGFVGQDEVPDRLAEQLVGTPFTKKRAGAILAIAGTFHDTAYKQVDADGAGKNAWPPFIAEELSSVANYSREYKDGKWCYITHLSHDGRTDALTNMVAHIFDVPKTGIVHNKGGNEFDSALAAAKFLERKGANILDIVAVVTAIACTIPFLPSIGFDEQGRLTNGFIGGIADRLQAVQLRMSGKSYELDIRTLNAIMCMGVHLGNRDTTSFTLPGNFGGVAEGGRRVKLEDVRPLREQQIAASGLIRATRSMQFTPGLYHLLAEFPETAPKMYLLRGPEGILGLDQAYPPKPVYDMAVAYTKENSEGAAWLARIHEIGVVFAGCIATLLGKPEAVIPGLVDSSLWEDDATPVGPIFEALQGGHQKFYSEQMHGTSQTPAGILTPVRSPISGFIYGAAGDLGSRLLSRSVQAGHQQAEEIGERDPFSNYNRAGTFVRQVREFIGPVNFHILIGQLIQVAIFYQDDPERGDPNRVAALEALLAN